MSLTGTQKEKLNEALCMAYPIYQDLDMMLTHRLNRRLPMIAPPAKMPIVVFEVIGDAEAKGWTPDLIVSAVEGNPGNMELYTVAQELELTALPSPLQRMISTNAAFIDIQPLVLNLTKTQGMVCRVEVPTTGGTIYGTGFLVGQSAVLTNHHLVDTIINGSGKPADVSLRFDYQITKTGKAINKGTVFELAKGWLLAKSEPDPLDFVSSPANSQPDPAHLDYALLQLSSDAGNQPVGGRAEPGDCIARLGETAQRSAQGR